MTNAVYPISRTGGALSDRMRRLGPAPTRLIFVAIVVASLAAGYVATGADAAAQATSNAGADLTRLMRFMAAIKGIMAVCAAAAVFWRLGTAITLPRLAVYAVACAAMLSAPGLIWSMTHVGLGALLLHGGLFATIVLLWRDPAVPVRLSALVAARRGSD